MEKLIWLLLLIGCASDPCIEYKRSLKYMSNVGDRSVKNYFTLKYELLPDTLSCEEKRCILLESMLECDVNELKARN